MPSGRKEMEITDVEVIHNGELRVFDVTAMVDWSVDYGRHTLSNGDPGWDGASDHDFRITEVRETSEDGDTTKIDIKHPDNKAIIEKIDAEVESRLEGMTEEIYSDDQAYADIDPFEDMDEDDIDYEPEIEL